jgi:hypothetical protein
MAHTPTPWRIATASPKFIADAEGIIVAQASVHAETSFDYAADNAARIVKAVNAHDDLVSVTRRNLATMEHTAWRLEEIGKSSAELRLAIKETRDALMKAGVAS